MAEEYNFFRRVGAYFVVIFIVWGVAYLINNLVFKTNIIITCFELPIVMLIAVVFEFIVGFMFEAN